MRISGTFSDRVSTEVEVRCHSQEDDCVRFMRPTAGELGQLIRHPDGSVLLEAVALDCPGVIE
jgi:hypothetical protein